MTGRERKATPGKPYDGGLVVLEGGDRDGWWYDLDDFLHSRRAAERMKRADGLAAYVKTRAMRPHPWLKAVGQVWALPGVPIRRRRT